MGYREPSTPTVLCAVTPESELHVLNGSTAEFAFPCFYDVAELDGSTTYEEIELAAEGYGEPSINLDDAPDGLSAVAWIDDTNGHILRLLLTAACPSAEDRDQEALFQMTISRTTDAHGTRIDVPVRGTILVKEGALPEAVVVS